MQSLHQKKYRHRHGAFLVEGGKSVLELLSSDLETEHVLATPEFADQYRAQLPGHVPVSPATEHELTQLGTLATNTTALAIARQPTSPPLPLTLPETGLLLALDEVRDPGNLGTLLRLADWYGLPGVVLSPGCADAYAP
ncbi:TrmH family RNA methyltransferase, partial [Hymenobacter agri]